MKYKHNNKSELFKKGKGYYGLHDYYKALEFFNHSLIELNNNTPTF
ncbi:MAG: hypothetical protein AB8U25_01500 [Rickettsiales endosymbiont of Dermacentor nuttalli]